MSHILILSSWYPTVNKPFLGNFVESQAELISKSHTVTVISIEPENNHQSGILITPKSSNLTIVTVYYKDETNKIGRYLNRKRAFNRGFKAIDKKVDIIHAHVALPFAPFYIYAKQYFNCPLILTEHASYYRKKLSFLNKIHLKRLSRKVDSIIAVSEILKQDISQVFPTNKIVVIPNGIDASRFSLEKKKNELFSFLHISTLDEIKQPRLIIDAFELAYNKRQDITLRIVSDESYLELKKYASSKSSKDNIYFEGPISHDHIPEKFAVSNAFVLASSYESFSIVLAEALMSGTPIISPKVGIANALPSHSGILLDNLNAESLSNAFLTMVDNEKNCDQKELRSIAMEFEQTHVLKLLNSLYDETRTR